MQKKRIPLSDFIALARKLEECGKKGWDKDRQEYERRLKRLIEEDLRRIKAD